MAENASKKIDSKRAGAKAAQAAGGMETLRKVLRYIGNYRFLLALSIVTAAISVVLTLYAPILFGNAIDLIIGPGEVDFSGIGGILLKILVIVLITSGVTWTMNLINNHLTYHVVEDIRAKAIRKIQQLPLSYLDSHSIGDLVGRVIADVDQLSDGLLLGFTQLFSGVVTIIVTLVFMFEKSVPVTLVVIILTPVSFLVARFIASRSYTMFRRMTDTRGQETALVEELVGNEKVVKAFGYEERASKRFGEVNEKLRNYSQMAVFFSSLTNPSTRAVNSVIYAVVALMGAYMILGGSLTVGGLSVLLSYANQYMKPFNDISSVVTELQNALACAARVFELIEAQPESADMVPAGASQEAHQLAAVKSADGKAADPFAGEASAPSAAPGRGHVEIDHVSFRYLPDRPLIEDFCLDAQPGQKIAIVGPTGCGKTTFINLLMRFYDVNSGQIRVDGVPVKNISRHDLRKKFGMVLQDTWLTHDTVRNNIAFGKPEASDEEIIAAAKEAHSWEFIRRMPQGLDTVITDDSLSAGQKQLLCITRVMLTLPPMLILDEATSSIDTRTELQIQNAFDKLMKGRTSFIVAHRLSTIRSADRILVMKDGRIIEQGTHDGLMAENGFYTNLYNSQFTSPSL